MSDDPQNLVSGDGFELYAAEALRISAQFYNTLVLGESGVVTIGFKADSVNGLRWMADMGAMCEGTAFACDLVRDFMRVHNYGRFVDLGDNEKELLGEKTARIHNCLGSIADNMRAAGDSLEHAALKTSVAGLDGTIQGSLNNVETSIQQVNVQQHDLVTASNRIGMIKEELNTRSETNAGTAAEVAAVAQRAITTFKTNCVCTVHTATTLNQMATSRTQT